MGKGDKKTRKGKIVRGTTGKTRPKSEGKKRAPKKPATGGKT